MDWEPTTPNNNHQQPAADFSRSFSEKRKRAASVGRADGEVDRTRKRANTTITADKVANDVDPITPTAKTDKNEDDETKPVIAPPGGTPYLTTKTTAKPLTTAEPYEFWNRRHSARNQFMHDYADEGDNWPHGHRDGTGTSYPHPHPPTAAVATSTCAFAHRRVASHRALRFAPAQPSQLRKSSTAEDLLAAEAAAVTKAKNDSKADEKKKKKKNEQKQDVENDDDAMQVD
jgi:hypothetical protein